MDIQKIKELALANGFSLKEQASGNMDLHSYVYEFANAIEQAAKALAVPEGFVLVPQESLKVALFWMHEDIDPWQMGGDSFADLYEHKPILEKALVESQEPTND